MALTGFHDDQSWLIQRPRLNPHVNAAAIAAQRIACADVFPVGFQFGTVAGVPIAPTSPTSTAEHLQPAEILIAYGGGRTAHFEGLVPVSGMKVHVNDKGIVPIHVVKDFSD